MGSDLFGSFAESSCAALVVASISSFGTNHDFTAMCYPLLISSMGIIVCLITTLFATEFFEIKDVNQIEPTLKRQLIISTILMTIGILIVSYVAVPTSFQIYNLGSTPKLVQWWYVSSSWFCFCEGLEFCFIISFSEGVTFFIRELFFCVAVGLWAGLIIGYTTEYFTSNTYRYIFDMIDR